MKVSEVGVDVYKYQCAAVSSIACMPINWLLHYVLFRVPNFADASCSPYTGCVI